MTEENPHKKMKTDENGDKEAAPATGVYSTLNTLAGFKVTNILGDNCDRKTITLQGNFEGHEGTGIVLLEKKAFNREAIDGFFSEKAVVAKDFCNDIYGSYNTQAHGEFGDIKTTIIHPATEKHIQKYSGQNIFTVNETPELYKTVCLPHLQKEYFNIDWVLNILDHKAETDRVVFEDPDPETGFILLPDLKWDCETKENLYVLAVVRKLNIVSIRDLTAEHLPLLRNVLNKGTAAIKEKYGLDGSELRIYFHYRPTFNHLHIHFTALKYDAPGCRVEKAHMLTSVISNIELMSDYYQRVSLPFIVMHRESLYAKLVEHGIPLGSTTTEARTINLSSVLVELRTRLGASQFHIKFKSPISKSHLESLQVTVKTPSTVQLKLLECVFTISVSFVQLIPDTISNLTADVNSVSFRIQASPDTPFSGSFEREVLLLQNSNRRVNYSDVPLPNVTYQVLCRTCKTVAIPSLELSRILPLPSSAWQEVEWFCHKHGDEEGATSSPLMPKVGDCFYSIHSWILPISTMFSEDVISSQNGSFSCAKCSSQLGCMENDTTVLYNFASSWSNKGNELDALSCSEAMEKVIVKLIAETSLNGMGMKLLLTTKDNSSLVLWPLNSPLKVSVLNPVPDGATDLQMNSHSSAICLLYSTENIQVPDDVQSIVVPSVLLSEVISILRHRNALLPDYCNASNGFSITFLYQ